MRQFICILALVSAAFGQSRSFDTTSTSNKLTLASGTVAQITGSTLTLFAYQNLSANGTQFGECLICVNNSGVNTQYLLQADRTDVCTAGHPLGQVDTHSLCYTGPNLNKWESLAYTLQSGGAGTETAFLRGLPTGQVNVNVGTIPNRNAPLTVGTLSADTVTIQIGQAAEWDIALSTLELFGLGVGTPANCLHGGSHLKAYWPINGLKSPEPDLSLNGNNLTVSGTTVGSIVPMMGCPGVEGAQAY